MFWTAISHRAEGDCVDVDKEAEDAVFASGDVCAPDLGDVDRAPLITPDLEERLYAVMQHHASRLGARVIAIGGVEDHVHMLLRIPSTLAVADLVSRVKGGSSHFAAQVLGRDFKWQGGYAAYSVSPQSLPRVREYVLNQKQRHADRNAVPDAVEAPNRTRERPVSGVPAV